MEHAPSFRHSSSNAGVDRGHNANLLGDLDRVIDAVTLADLAARKVDATVIDERPFVDPVDVEEWLAAVQCVRRTLSTLERVTGRFVERAVTA